MSSTSIGLIINHSYCQLPEAYNEYFYFEDAEGLNREEGVTKRSYRMFFPCHPRFKKFMEKLGPENTFIFSRVLFSYFDASYMLFNFTVTYAKDFSMPSFANIEEKAREYDINSFNYLSVDKETLLGLYDNDQEKILETYSFSPNEFQELFWTMNMENILTTYGIPYYPDKMFTNEEQKINNITLLTYKMLKIKEVGMVMHTWRKLNSYARTDFIDNINNILEFVKNDVESNTDTFDTESENFSILKELIRITAHSKRQLYFGLFNSTDLLGFVSRHGSNNLVDYHQLSTNTELKMTVIKENMSNGIIPNQKEIQHMFNVWHYTTSLAVTLWFRLKKQR